MFSWNILCDLKDFEFRGLMQNVYIVLQTLVWNLFKKNSLTTKQIIMFIYKNQTKKIVQKQTD